MLREDRRFSEIDGDSFRDARLGNGTGYQGIKPELFRGEVKRKPVPGGGMAENAGVGCHSFQVDDETIRRDRLPAVQREGSRDQSRVARKDRF
jgi:hypothetical protein